MNRQSRNRRVRKLTICGTAFFCKMWYDIFNMMGAGEQIELNN